MWLRQNKMKLVGVFLILVVGIVAFFHEGDVSSGEEILAEAVKTEVVEAEVVEADAVEAGAVETETVEVPQEKVETADVSEAVLTATLSVRCDEILENLDKLDENKRGIVPDDGVIFPTTEVEFYEGETVFHVLLREMKRNKIHMEYTNTPIYNSAYIEGIGNLYEFDCGPLSGWLYSVNEWFPNYGVSGYVLADGDVISLVYTCEGGGNM
ncbi:MAG: DUF4430 domain-containing protein [Bacillota bacterium]